MLRLFLLHRELSEINTKSRLPRRFLKILENVRPDGILVEFLGALEWLKDLHDGIPVYAGSSLNIFNSEAADTLTRWDSAAYC